jgi:hypothetical protein
MRTSTATAPWPSSVGASLPALGLVLALGACSSRSESVCENAGGSCHTSMPDGCLNYVVGHTGAYSCSPASSVCCLPLSFSACEEGGGKCVTVGACPSGNIGNPATYSCGAGVPLACCLPNADRGP